MTLRRHDGKVYLDRWGFECKWAGVYLHRMEAPDPGLDLHDHPWSFLSIVLAGGYTEERADTRYAPTLARVAERMPAPGRRGFAVRRGALTARLMRLDECHRVVALHAPRVWTLVLRGPRRRPWGFYMRDGWIDEPTYDATVRVDRRDLWLDGGPVEAMLRAKGSNG